VITRLYFENLRAFERLDIPLSRINCFFGPNNSGKSAIISAITLLSQTLDSADRDVPLLLNGKFEQLGSYFDTVFEHDLNRDIKIGLELLEDPPPRGEPPQSLRFEVLYHYRPQRRQIVVKGIEIDAPLNKMLLKTRVSQRSNTQIVEEVSPEFAHITLGATSSGTISTNRFLPYLERSLTRPWFFRATKRADVNRRRESYLHLDMQLYQASELIRSHLSKVQFIGPFRRRPERTYTFSGEAPSSVGASGDKCIDILASDQSRRKGKRQNIAEKVSTWLKQSQIASAITVLPLTDTRFEIHVKHIHTGEDVNIADAGFGISQILPILVAGYSVPRNSSLIVEEPEIHLHPKAQAEIGTFFLNVLANNVQIFVETHSEHLLLRLQRHIASGDLMPQDVNTFYVYSEEQTKHKIERLIPLGADGYFTEQWPQGFFPERLIEAEQIAKLSYMRAHRTT
jgi:predicted ATPase